MQTISEDVLKQKDIEKTFFSLRETILPFVQEPYPMLQKALQQHKGILLEGAHGMFLDNDWGTYPFVTASTVLSGGTNAAAGIPPQKITEVIGVVKAYTTRVGAGPFPTELLDTAGEQLRKAGGEFGTTTGRPRRCGWFDAELIKFAAQINGFTAIALTKLDVLDSFTEIPICIGYTVNGKKVNYYDGDAFFLQKVTPVYTTMKGWMTKTQGITHFSKLPPAAQRYIKAIEKLVRVPIAYISTGPERHAIIKR